MRFNCNKNSDCSPNRLIGPIDWDETITVTRKRYQIFGLIGLGDHVHDWLTGTLTPLSEINPATDCAKPQPQSSSQCLGG